MSATVVAVKQPSVLGLSLARYRGPLIALAVFVLLFLIVNTITPGAFSYFEFSFMSSGGATLALGSLVENLLLLK
jgi:ribose transport system permease protein